MPINACVVGAGSWGSAFALHLGRLRIRTALWIREREIFEELETQRRNSVFLPGLVFPDEVEYFTDIQEAVRPAEFVFVAVPSPFCRQVYSTMASALSAGQVVVSLTKGIEEGSLKRMTEVMKEIFYGFARPHLAVLSGPSFSKEVAEKHPTAVVIAAEELKIAQTIQRLVSNIYFRAYAGEDVVGVELAGAVKNIIALATGISDSLKFGHNSRAALITRGLAEMIRLGVKQGASKETYFGLAGIGDLVLTCTAKLSRNYHVGYDLGKGKPLSQILAATRMVAEGVTTTFSVRQLARRENIEMPISEEVYQILYKNKNPKESLRDLMSRGLKGE